MQKTRSIAVFGLAILILCSGVSWGATNHSAAEQLIQHLPEETFALLASSGSDQVKPAFDLSFMGQLSGDPGVQNFVKTIKQQLLSQLPEDAPSAQQIEKMLNSIQGSIKYPMVFGLAQWPIQDETFGLYGYAIWDTGDQKVQMHQ